MSDRKLMMQMLEQETERTKLCIELRSRVAELEAALIHEYHELTGAGDYRGEKLMTAQDKIDYMIARVPK